MLYLLVSWAWLDWPLTNHHPSVLWHCWLGHVTHKIVSESIYNASSGTLNPTIPIPYVLHLVKCATHLTNRTVKLTRWHCCTILLPLSDSAVDVPVMRYSGFKCKICANINTASCLTWHQTTNRYKPSTTVVSKPVLSTVVNEMWCSEPVFHNRRQLCWRHQVEQEVVQLLFTVRYSW